MIKRKNIIFICLLLALPLLPAFFLSGSIVLKKPAPVNDPYRKKISDLKAQEVLWVDSRPRQKYDLKHIPNALWVNEKDWEQVLAQLFEVFEPGRTIVVYCNQGCASSRGLAKRLREELGQDNIYYLEGGVDSWFTNTPQ